MTDTRTEAQSPSSNPIGALWGLERAQRHGSLRSAGGRVVGCATPFWEVTRRTTPSPVIIATAACSGRRDHDTNNGQR